MKVIWGLHPSGSWIFVYLLITGDSANAVPHYQKLRTRVIHIWDNRKGQPNRSAMERPHPEETSFEIKVIFVPGKYENRRISYSALSAT